MRLQEEELKKEFERKKKLRQTEEKLIAKRAPGKASAELTEAEEHAAASKIQAQVRGNNTRAKQAAPAVKQVTMTAKKIPISGGFFGAGKNKAQFYDINFS